MGLSITKKLKWEEVLAFSLNEAQRLQNTWVSILDLVMIALLKLLSTITKSSFLGKSDIKTRVRERLGHLGTVN